MSNAAMGEAMCNKYTLQIMLNALIPIYSFIFYFWNDAKIKFSHRISSTSTNLMSTEKL